MDWNYIVGIDPGRRGAFARIRLEDGRLCDVASMPETPSDVCGLVAEWHRAFRPVRWYLERVQGMPTDAAHHAFNFGQGFGILMGAMLTLARLHQDVSVEQIRPQAWMKELEYSTGGDKSVSKRKCQELFPEFPHGTRCTKENCEAVLIAEAGRRRWLQQHPLLSPSAQDDARRRRGA